jgi:hypothetical protein
MKRVGQAIGFNNCKNASLAIFLLYLATLKLSKNFTNAQIACSCLHLADRLVNQRTSWPSYCELVTSLTYTDLVSCAHSIAIIYVDWYN